MKVVRKDLFRQDPKAEQNLRREIDLLFKLKNCEYVVRLYHVEVREKGRERERSANQLRPVAGIACSRSDGAY